MYLFHWSSVVALLTRSTDICFHFPFFFFIFVQSKPLIKTPKTRLISLLVLPQLLTAQLNRIQPQPQFLWTLGTRLSARELLHHLQDIHLGQTLFRRGDGPHEVVAQRDELLLNVDRLLVPPDQLEGGKQRIN